MWKPLPPVIKKPVLSGCVIVLLLWARSLRSLRLRWLRGTTKGIDAVCDARSLCHHACSVALVVGRFHGRFPRTSGHLLWVVSGLTQDGIRVGWRLRGQMEHAVVWIACPTGFLHPFVRSIGCDNPRLFLSPPLAATFRTVTWAALVVSLMHPSGHAAETAAIISWLPDGPCVAYVGHVAFPCLW